MIDIDFYQPEQPYFGEIVKKFDQNSNSKEKEIVISGFPYDEGTKINGGRVGGHIAPTIFRKTLQQADIYADKEVKILDSGDIKSQLPLGEAHEELFKKHKKILSQNSDRLLFSIGGSNDQSYPNVRSLLETYPNDRIGVINLDAHFDVRPLKNGQAHSGSPFRLMLQNQIFQKNKSKFIQFANLGSACSSDHYKYLKEHNVDVYWLSKNIRLYDVNQENKEYKTQAGQLFEDIMKKLSQEVEHIFISFDTDCINSKWMPGVSAPNVLGGLTPQEAVQIMKISGLNKKVKLLDFSQFNPAVESLLSSKLLVQMFYAFSMSFGERK